MSGFSTQVIESAISVSTEKIITAVFLTAIFAMLFIGFFILVKFLKRKYQNQPIVDV